MHLIKDAGVALMPTVLLIKPDGTVTDVELPSGDSLQAMYAAIGCRAVDVVRLTTQLDMWIDDEGLWTQIPNQPATALARRYGCTSQAYHGPALITGFDPGTGDTTGLTPDQVRAVLGHLADIAA
jgi:hypothetical protein